MKEIGHRLVQIRKNLGLTQKEMADRFQVSVGSIQGYEYGKVPKGEVLKKLSDHGYNMNWLFTGDGEMMSGVSGVERSFAWNSVYYLCKRTDMPYDPELFADTFMEIHDWMVSNNRKDESDQVPAEVTAKIIDFAVQRLKKA